MSERDIEWTIDYRTSCCLTVQSCHIQDGLRRACISRWGVAQWARQTCMVGGVIYTHNELVVPASLQVVSDVKRELHQQH